MLADAGIGFKHDSGEGWSHRLLLEGDRAFVFDSEGNLAGIRNHDDTANFDGTRFA